MMDYGANMGRLAATCQNKDNASQSMCLGVVWSVIEKMEFEREICLPPNLNPVFDYTLKEISRYPSGSLSSLNAKR